MLTFLVLTYLKFCFLVLFDIILKYCLVKLEYENIFPRK